MAKKNPDKFHLEAQPLVVNVKIATENVNNEPGSSDLQKALREALSQLAEVAGLYGYNAILGLINTTIEILNRSIDTKLPLPDNFLAVLYKLDEVLEKLINDPVLNAKKLKQSYEGLVTELDTILKEDFKEHTEDASAMPTNRFQEVFTEEAFDLINQLEEKMLQLESDMQDTDMIDKVFRIMHTLKGNSNMFGYQHLGEITHELENIYDDIRSNKIQLTREILEITLECIDHFRNLIDDPTLSNESVKEQHSDILSLIKQLLSGDVKSASENTQEQSKTEAQGIHTFYLFFKPEHDVFNDGTNPMYFVYDIHELGNCVVVPVFDNELNDISYNPEKCNTSWHILISLDGSKEDVEEHFMFLKEESQPAITLLSDQDLLKDNTYIDSFKKQVEGKNTEVKLEAHIVQDKEPKLKSRGLHKIQKASSESISSVRVASQKIDVMMNLISELVTKQAELSMLVHLQEETKLMEVAEHIENISRDLRDNAFSISLIPIEKSVLRFQRLVRDVSNRFDKKVDFVIEGKDTELDKTIIEKIVDPIMHILRNSIDHGIELPEVRKKKGKPENGTILLKAYPSGAHVVIEISDDGAGINLDKVKNAAINKGILNAADKVKEDELLNLIVSPGFSTAENVSEVSGRGVGMDVVNQKIAEIRGELEIRTEKDKGTVITIKLPLTISIIDSLLLKCDGDYFLVPLGVVERCAAVNSEQIINAENKYVVLAEEFIPFVDLRTEFAMEGDRPDLQQVLIVRHREDVVGVVVDEVIGNYQAVLKALGDVYKQQEIVSGASILGSGEIALVLDTNKIIQEYSAKKELRMNELV